MASHKADFPIFSKYPNLVYLDSGATTHKPQSVIDRMGAFYANEYGTVHRGIYDLSVASTQRYQAARQAVADDIHAPSVDSVIFTRGTTAAINLAAFGYVLPRLQPGDEVLITEVEHHANLVPWQEVARQAKATVVYAPIEDDGSFDLVAFERLITQKTAFISVTHISNVLGTVLPVQAIADLAKSRTIPLLIDGAQAIAHASVDMGVLDPDFYCFSAHKMYGPTGIGVLYASERVMGDMQPVSFGGDMIESVSKAGSTWAKPPLMFESGTPPIVEAIGLMAAIDYIQSIGRQAIQVMESHLTQVLLTAMDACPWIHVLGRAPERSATVSFTIEGVHPHDIGSIVNEDDVAIRVGHHCAQPTMIRFGVPATARASFGVYNEEHDIDRLMRSLHTVKDIFGE